MLHEFNNGDNGDEDEDDFECSGGDAAPNDALAGAVDAENDNDTAAAAPDAVKMVSGPVPPARRHQLSMGEWGCVLRTRS